MATRNGRPVSLYWLHMNVGHPSYPEVVEMLRLVHEASGDVRLSVNMKADGSQSIVKLLGPLPVLSPPQMGAVIRMYVEEDHEQLTALVSERVADPVGAPDQGWTLPDDALLLGV